ncbi:AsmA-like C-terminal region-containing protein [Horticoccus sp. 23ND18S-11]|uniref:AsmA-like C-terminal region-containing protein n=1 Tax=Horticoccus sp. 23ND18S-11 TaxID=3391832 RepID=UPI0039C93F29
MKSWKDLGARAVLTCLGWVGSLVLWTLWLGLVLVLVFQLYILAANELTLPDFILRRLETQLAESGLRATFSRTTFDPSGRVLIEDIKLSLPAFNEPVVTARAAYVRLSPWFLVVGRVEPREIRLMGVTASVPAMLSPTGASATLVRDLDVTLEPSDHAVAIHQLNGRIAGVVTSVRGSVLLRKDRSAPPGESLTEIVTQRFSRFCRQALAVADFVTQFDEPMVNIEVFPSESGAPTLRLLALARTLRLKAPVAVEARNLRASTTLLLFGDAPPSDVAVSVSDLQLPDGASARGVNARIIGRYRLDDGQFDLREVALTTDAVSVADVNATAVSARMFPRGLPRFETSAVFALFGAPLFVRADVDLGTRQAAVRFEGAVSPAVLEVVSKRVGTDVRRFYEFESLQAQQGEVRLGPGWKFERLRARVAIPRMNSYGVIMEEGRAVVELEPGRFGSPEAFARVGENFASGTYEHDLTTHRYRFLLDGRLRPLAISRWFREWWPDFFRQLDFTAGPPDASVDVRGTWRDSGESNVFVFADTTRPVIRGTPFDRVRTRLFIRPAYFDSLELLATAGTGETSGRFTYVGNPETQAWQSLDLRLDSTFDLPLITRLLGATGEKILVPFQLARPPTLKLEGRFAPADAPGGRVEKLRIDARTTGNFRFHGFPLQDVSFIASVDRDEITLDDIAARFAGGNVSGHARVWGEGAARRVGFDVALVDSSLGLVAASLEEFFAGLRGQPPAPPGKFVQEKANVRLDLAASAEGRYDSTTSYHGDGNAVLNGAEIGEVPLLGTLSELFKFTALRFTEARANFKIDGGKLVFPQFIVRGSNSKIDAHGTYDFERQGLDFNAKIFPFQESESLLKTVVGAVLSPLSNAFEVKLKGSLEKPDWTFVRGPTNFLRALAPGDPDAPKPEATPGEADAPAPPPNPGATPPPAAPPPP